MRHQAQYRAKESFQTEVIWKESADGRNAVRFFEKKEKKFSRSGKDDNSFGKEVFSKYVYSHRDEIDFSNFKYLLNGIRDIVTDYSQSLQ